MGSRLHDAVAGVVMKYALTGPHRVVDRLSGGRLGRSVVGAPSIWLRTTGRRSGQPRRTPLVTAREGRVADAPYLVTGSSAGMEKTPAWVHNLRGHEERGEPVVVEDGGREVAADVTELHGAERDAGFAAMVRVYRGFAGYERRASRTLPVFRLTPRG